MAGSEEHRRQGSAGGSADDGGLRSRGILAAADNPANKEKLKANTDEAVARGVFGAPTFFVGDEMHFGQDRLDFVEEALRA